MKIDLYNYGAVISGEMKDNDFHRHECIQLSIPKTDSVVYFPEEEINLKAGECIVISANTPHKIEHNNWNHILVDNECVHGEELKKILHTMSYKIEADNSFIKILFNESQDVLSNIKVGLRAEIIQAISIIKNHDHNCTLTEIASQVSLSPDRFRKVFKEEVGITFKNYLKWNKIKRAFFIMNSNDHKKLVDIAHHSGFSDQAHMSKIIKETFGYNPKIIKNNL